MGAKFAVGGNRQTPPNGRRDRWPLEGEMHGTVSGEVPLWGALRVLQLARVILGDGDRWTQNQYARDRDGHTAEPTDTDAAMWCSWGALRLALTRLGGPDGLGIVGLDRVGTLDRIGKFALMPFVPDNRAIADWNDEPTTTWEDVKAVFDKAIDYIEARIGGPSEVRR